MFSFSTCPFCLRAKQILEEDYGEQIEVYECDLESVFRQQCGSNFTVLHFCRMQPECDWHAILVPGISDGRSFEVLIFSYCVVVSP